MNVQSNTLEAEQEQLYAAMKKQRKTDPGKAERMTLIDHRLERHKFHINNLELILRLLDNNSVTVEQVNQIKDDINYYIDENHDDDFQDDDEIYQELHLEGADGFGGFTHDGGDSDSEPEGKYKNLCQTRHCQARRTRNPLVKSWNQKGEVPGPRKLERQSSRVKLLLSLPQ